MKELIAKINAVVDAIKVDIVKEDNKAAQARVRKATLELEKLGKEYRKASTTVLGTIGKKVLTNMLSMDMSLE